MTSQTGQQIITLQILSNISRSKVNQAMKLGQLIEHNERNIFFKNRTENYAGILVPELFFLKALYKVKTNSQHLSFNIFW